MFGSRVGFSGSSDRMALFRFGPNSIGTEVPYVGEYNARGEIRLVSQSKVVLVITLCCPMFRVIMSIGPALITEWLTFSSSSNSSSISCRQWQSSSIRIIRIIFLESYARILTYETLSYVNHIVPLTRFQPWNLYTKPDSFAKSNTPLLPVYLKHFSSNSCRRTAIFTPSVDRCRLCLEVPPPLRVLMPRCEGLPYGPCPSSRPV